MTKHAAIAVPISKESTRRTRASEKALRITLTAICEAGLSVDKVCVNGGQIEIHCGPIAARPSPKKDGGLKEW
ncbi:hypothetical protein PDO_1181 [Rhizobium sp. PDO1-076]|uniref:hypothetical protein n=1 Tax=Rhizobium sp. PDO1-076 TaxID=1125979 RepID=UPI00024E3E21|nr:hypothetical protein [Rhizobium sp. PDO1-076]EHS53218.1 hypothetical protein PDO_1181 [Rhizobium sp. PDO1-076]